MAEVYVSRYLHRAAPDVVAALDRHRDLGPSFHLHEHLWLVPLTRQAQGRLELRGELRVLTVASGTEPVCELLLVGEVAEEATVDAETVVEALVAELEQRAQPRPEGPGQAA